MAKVKYVGNNPSGQVGAGIFFPYNVAVEVPLVLLGPLLGRGDFEAADAEAEEYVPAPRQTYSDVVVSDQTGELAKRGAGIIELPYVSETDLASVVGAAAVDAKSATLPLGPAGRTPRWPMPVDATDPAVLASPPAGWTVVNVPAGAGKYSTTDQSTVTPTNRYIIVNPYNRPIRVRGAIDVVIVGCKPTVDNGANDAPASSDRRSIELQNITGIAHLEGLELVHQGTTLGREGDGVYVHSSPTATLRLVNCRGQIYGTQAGDHGDFVQVYNGSTARGVARLQLDLCSISTDYQGVGIFDGGPLDSIELYRTDITYTGPAGSGGILFAVNNAPLEKWVMDGVIVRSLRSGAIGNALSNGTASRGAWSTGGTFSNLTPGAVFTSPDVNGGKAPALTYVPDAPSYCGPVGAGYKRGKPTVSGSRGGNAALASLMSQLAALGLITDSTSA